MRNFSLFFLVFLFAVLAKAQTEGSLRAGYPAPLTEESSRDHFIIEVGYIGAISTDESDFSNVQHGLSGGFLFDVYGEHYFTAETGLFMTQQGFDYKSEKLTAVGTTDISTLQNVRVVGKLTYIGLPILEKFNLAGRVTNTPFIIGGVTPQFLVSKDISVQGQDTSGKIQSTQPTDTEFDPPTYDITGVIGIGGSFKYSENKTLLIQATYNRGFVPIDNLQAGICNQSFLLTVGFGVDL